jgi:hypothetical protein
MNRHWELEIETLQSAPRDPDKLEWLLKVKERQNEEARHIEGTQKGSYRIEMLKFVFGKGRKDRRNKKKGWKSKLSTLYVKYYFSGTQAQSVNTHVSLSIIALYPVFSPAKSESSLWKNI